MTTKGNKMKKSKLDFKIESKHVVTVPPNYEYTCNQINSFNFKTEAEVEAFKLGFTEAVNRT